MRCEDCGGSLYRRNTDRELRRHEREILSSGIQDARYFSLIARSGTVNDSMQEAHTKLLRAIHNLPMARTLNYAISPQSAVEDPDAVRDAILTEDRMAIIEDSLYGRASISDLLNTLYGIMIDAYASIEIPGIFYGNISSIQDAVRHFTLKAVALRLLFAEEQGDILEIAVEYLNCVIDAYTNRIRLTKSMGVAWSETSPAGTPVYSSTGFQRSLNYLQKQVTYIESGKKVSMDRMSKIVGTVRNLRSQNRHQTYPNEILSLDGHPPMDELLQNCHGHGFFHSVFGPSLVVATDTDRVKYLKTRKKPRKRRSI